MNLNKEFHSRGYTNPQSILQADISYLQQHLENIIKRDDVDRLEERNERHLDLEVIKGMCLDSAIVATAKQILGSNVLLYSSTIFIKYPGDPAFPWHQDGRFLHVNPISCITVWLAIDDCFKKNGALRFIDSTHNHEVPHLDRSNQRASFQAYADPKEFHANNPKTINLKSGEFVAFHPFLMHSSGTNLSLERRAGLAIRFTIPSVKIDHSAFFEGHMALTV